MSNSRNDHRLNKRNDNRSNNKNNYRPNKECAIFCPLFSLIFIIIIFMSYIYNQINTLKYNEYKCFIENVLYPSINLNTSNIIMNGFVECNCGRHCTSDLGICIKIFGKILETNQTKLLQYKTVDGTDDTCTFRENDCKNSEGFNDRYQATIIARNKALSYLNTTRNCYSKDNNYYFLNNDMNMTGIIILGIILGIIISCCLSIIILYKMNNKENIKIIRDDRNQKSIIIENSQFKINYI